MDRGRYFVKTSDLRRTLGTESKLEKEAFIGAIGKTLKGLKSLKSLKAFKATNTGQMVDDIYRAGKSKGFFGALDEAAKYKHPEINIGKNIPKKLKLPKPQKIESTLGRGARSVVGNTADNIKSLTKNFSKDKSFSENALTAGKNFKDTVVRQLKGSQYTEKDMLSMDPKALKKFRGRIGTNEQGKKILKSKFLPDREIVQETGRGLLVKKRLPMRAIAPFTTSPGAAGAGASSYLAQSLFEPNKSTGKKVKQSLKDGGAFLAGDAIGWASLFI